MAIDADNGILLKPETLFQETMFDEVVSCLKCHGKPKGYYANTPSRPFARMRSMVASSAIQV